MILALITKRKGTLDACAGAAARLCPRLQESTPLWSQAGGGLSSAQARLPGSHALRLLSAPAQPNTGPRGSCVLGLQDVPGVSLRPSHMLPRPVF